MGSCSPVAGIVLVCILPDANSCALSEVPQIMAEAAVEVRKCLLEIFIDSPHTQFDVCKTAVHCK